ncbi:MAG TPA: IS200/IS605 family transposase [Urbifossiella sp.]|nr:IS200/IS605 family transposase [Urbifossiella sp.]
MPQSHTRLLYHLVFCTRRREPLIAEPWASELYAVFGGIVRDRRGDMLAAGGVADHVHLLARLPADLAVSDVVRDIKAVSSGWRHDQGDTGFWWQNGYGAFTVSASKVDTVSGYIARQPEHHKRQSLRDEYLGLLRRHGIDVDENHLWE